MTMEFLHRFLSASGKLLSPNYSTRWRRNCGIPDPSKSVIRLCRRQCPVCLKADTVGQFLSSVLASTQGGDHAHGSPRRLRGTKLVRRIIIAKSVRRSRTRFASAPKSLCGSKLPRATVCQCNPLICLIPNPIDQNPWAHWRSPMDMMRQG